ncbi:hypothetical protein EDD16DRAFT_1700658 [Pisolithus croceorrhizus]|nr:hypothetical protein EDD16DRAFT_1700658 [Pisolithus croceorrhizus]KAI6131346.1 hypothetical protein EV401DRAFT_2065685 [Pisolithus croceorrhizus]KAI6161189.1 hypothetical protein EDD17DRAFT_1759568 [Pisolithus thermaeus]
MSDDPHMDAIHADICKLPLMQLLAHVAGTGIVVTKQESRSKQRVVERVLADATPEMLQMLCEAGVRHQHDKATARKQACGWKRHREDGNDAPCKAPPATILASMVSITFIGVGPLPKNCLRSTFRVRRHAVRDALRWLQQNNPKYYGSIEIDASRLEDLPVDDVPIEISSVIRQSEDTSVVERESDGYVPVDDDEGRSIELWRQGAG